MIDKNLLGMVWHKLDCPPILQAAQAETVTGTGTPTTQAQAPTYASWGTVLANAAIIAGTTLFTTLTGMSITGIISTQGLAASGIAAGLAFCTSLSIQRGINKSQ